MRRFSQRNSLVTLNDINITPLLDLAFVLLIIFVITTPLLEQGLNLQLPKEAGKPDKPLQKSDIETVEVGTQGSYMYKGRFQSLDEIERSLIAAKANPNMVVFIRADADGPYRNVADILERCERNGITRISLRTDPKPRNNR